MDEALLVQAIADQLSSGANQPLLSVRDVLIIFACITFMAVQIIKVWRPEMGAGGKQKEANDLITQKDPKGVYYFLRLPEYFERMTRAIERLETNLSSKMTHLVNHQSGLIDAIDKRQNDLRKEVRALAEKK